MKRYEVVEHIPQRVVYYECENCGHHSKTNDITHCDYCGKEICTHCSKNVTNNKFDNEQPKGFENVYCFHVCSDCVNVPEDKIYEKLQKDKQQKLEELEQQLKEYKPAEVQLRDLRAQGKALLRLYGDNNE